MAIDEAQVRHVALLARLAIDEDEVKQYTEQLARILDHVAELSTVDTTDCPPTLHVWASMQNVVRADQPEPTLPPNAALAAAPDSGQQQFRVPAVIDDEG